MKYAVTQGQRGEAEPGLTGACPSCGHAMIAKCGELKIWHWAHSGKRICDPWWENETEWHRKWKAHFPKDWQEFVQRAEDGEKHIADVKTEQGYVIEFQHSHIKPEERQAREDFYKKMLWIVDGTRRVRDKDKFLDGCEFAGRIDGRDDLRASPGGGALLRDWGDRTVPVLFDFGDDHLWGLLPKTQEGREYGFRVERNAVIEALHPSAESKSSFDGLLRGFIGTISAHEWHLKLMRERSFRDPLQGFHLPNNRYSSRRRSF
ncbi:MAG: competence protein CoiA [Bacteriovoracia bacterium]